MPFLEKMSGGLLQARAQQAISARDAAVYGGDVYRPSQGVPERMAESGDRWCSAAGCTSTWLKPWKSRRRPIFEEDWACSGRCLQTLVRAAASRSGGAGAAGPGLDYASATAAGA